MKLTLAFLATTLAAGTPERPVKHQADDFQEATNMIKDKYSSNDHQNTAWTGQTASCPVQCKFDGRKLKVEHLLGHGKMSPWVGGVDNGDENEDRYQAGGIAPGSNKNKVFHRCFHRMAGTTGELGTAAGKTNMERECQCECAAWSNDTCDVAETDCPTQCGQEASTLSGSAAALCKFHQKSLRVSQCLASDKPDESCSVSCPATESCCVQTELASFTEDGDFSAGAHGIKRRGKMTRKCDETKDRLSEEQGQCQWTSEKQTFNTPHNFSKAKVTFNLKAFQKGSGGLENSDYARVHVRTCSDSNCGPWGQSTKRNDTPGEKWASYYFDVHQHDTKFLRDQDSKIQVMVVLKNSANKEEHILDDLVITGMCA